jgi:hypothetical protein
MFKFPTVEYDIGFLKATAPFTNVTVGVGATPPGPPGVAPVPAAPVFPATPGFPAEPGFPGFAL